MEAHQAEKTGNEVKSARQEDWPDESDSSDNLTDKTANNIPYRIINNNHSQRY